MNEAETLKPERYHLIDTVRGICILGMIIYHTLFDVVLLFGLDYSYLDNDIINLIRDFGASCFIFIAGICFIFEKKHLRRAIVLNVCGAVITGVTFLLMPDAPVLFGILTFMGISGLIFYLLSGLLFRIPPAAGLILSIISFLLLFRCNYGYFGTYHSQLFIFPSGLYRNYLTTFFGFPFEGFASSDYFPVFPWLFIYCAGFFFARLIGPKLGGTRILYYRLPVLTKAGKYSLYIYLAHQPLIYGIVYLLSVIIHKTP